MSKVRHYSYSFSYAEKKINFYVVSYIIDFWVCILLRKPSLSEIIKLFFHFLLNLIPMQFTLV